MKSKYFRREEFACNCGCGLSPVDAELLEVLEDVREHFSMPVKITSGNRCKIHNTIVGGELNSKHMLGIAADIQVKTISPNMVAQYLETKYPDKYGIGKYNTWTHIDVREKKARWDNRSE